MKNQPQHPALKEMRSSGFLKQIKDSKDLNNFIDELFT